MSENYIGYDTTKMLAADVSTAIDLIDEKPAEAKTVLTRVLDILNSRLHTNDRRRAGILSVVFAGSSDISIPNLKPGEEIKVLPIRLGDKVVCSDDEDIEVVL